MSEPSGRSAVITGAGSGLGRDLALQLAAKGYVVFGTALAPAEALDLKQASAGRVSLTVCDITKPEAVKAWAAGVTEALGERGLDLLISNAGILTPGPLEVLPLDAIRREFEVNVFGGLSVINAFWRRPETCAPAARPRPPRRSSASPTTSRTNSGDCTARRSSCSRPR